MTMLKAIQIKTSTNRHLAPFPPSCLDDLVFQAISFIARFLWWAKVLIRNAHKAPLSEHRTQNDWSLRPERPLGSRSWLFRKRRPQCHGGCPTLPTLPRTRDHPPLRLHRGRGPQHGHGLLPSAERGPAGQDLLLRHSLHEVPQISYHEQPESDGSAKRRLRRGVFRDNLHTGRHPGRSACPDIIQ